MAEECFVSKRQELFDFLRQVAGLTFTIHDPALVLRSTVMAAEAVLESPSAEIGAFRIIGIPRFRVGRYVTSRHDDRIPLDRMIVHDARMAGRTTLPLTACVKCFHVLSVTHDQADILDGRGKVSRGHLGGAKNMLMAAETDVRINLRPQIMRLSGRPEQIHGEVFGSRPCLIMEPSCKTWPNMAGDTCDLFMGRLHPTVVRWGNRMAAGTEFRMVGQWDGDCAEGQRSGG